MVRWEPSCELLNLLFQLLVSTANGDYLCRVLQLQQQPDEILNGSDTEAASRNQNRKSVRFQSMLLAHCALIFLLREDWIDRNPTHADFV